MEKETLKLLLKQKEDCQYKINHAIQNEFNPYANNGSKRLEQYRKEMERINKEFGLTTK